jgi:chromosomal replication initiator protein
VGGFSSTKLNPKYTFSNFAVGDCNHLAYAAAMGISEKPGCSYNPLFIYSKVGLGKTHLLHAIGHVASSHGFRVLCVSTEQFTNEFISAIKERETEKFRNKFRSVDLLLIDDVHFIGGKEQTQESFFHTFNELHNANHQIVITSNCPPRSVPSLEDRLCSRFEGGLTIGIQPPDFNTRLAILQNKVKQHQVNFSEEALKIIAERYHQNVRELEGALNHVIAHIKLTGESLSTRVVQQALLDEYEVMTSPPSPSLIVCTVGEYFHIPPQDLTGRKRTPQISQARQLAIYLIREENHCPLNGIGKIFGGRDHSTILQSYRRIATEINTNCQIRQQVEDIKAILARGGEGMGRGGFL